MEYLNTYFLAVWGILLDSAFYILLGIGIAGLFKVMMNTNTVLKHLGKGRYLSTVKAAFFGIPLPLCSCGVLPAAAALRKQGANRGATTAFLISTPESGVDSIATSYALLDPIMTVIRPVAAFFTAVVAGILENLFFWEGEQKEIVIDRSCPVDGCCDGVNCPDELHRHHHSFTEKLKAGLRFAGTSVWGDIAVWFFIGVLLAALIETVVPDRFMTEFLGGGFGSMLIMLVVGIPLYICATASTPVAAALILKGVSPGAALVFLLVGPATNITSLSVLVGVLGRKSVALYLTTLSVLAVLFGLFVDYLYSFLGISPKAVIGDAAELIPYPVQVIAVMILLWLSIKPVKNAMMAKMKRKKEKTVFFSDFPIAGTGNFSEKRHSHGGCECDHHH